MAESFILSEHVLGRDKLWSKHLCTCNRCEREFSPGDRVITKKTGYKQGSRRYHWKCWRSLFI